MNLSFFRGGLRFLRRSLKEISFYCAMRSIIPYVLSLIVLYLYIFEKLGFSLFYYYRGKKMTVAPIN